MIITLFYNASLSYLNRFEVLIKILPKNNLSTKPIIPIAKIIEAQLFKVAPSFEDYRNTDTLVIRVKIIARRIFCKRVTQMKTQNDRYKLIAAALCK